MADNIKKREYICKYLLTKIKNLYGVCGLAGNIKCESAFNTDIMEASWEKRTGWNSETYVKAINDGSYRDYRISGNRRYLVTSHANDCAITAFSNDYIGFGLCQWTWKTRKQRLFEYIEKNIKPFDISSEKGQCEYLIQELTSTYKMVGEILVNASSIEQASNAVLQGFERPIGWDTEKVMKERAGYSRFIHNEVFGGKLTFDFDLEGKTYKVVNGRLQ